MLRKVSFALCYGVSALVLAGVVMSCGGGTAGGGNTADPTYVLSGKVTGVVQQGVTISLSGAAMATTTTNTSGAYSFSGLTNGYYTVTASLANYAFNPASRPSAINYANAVTPDFISEHAYSISGNVVNGSAVAIADVVMTLTGGGLASAQTVTTDSVGNYTFSGMVTNGTYTLTPSKSQTRIVCRGVSLPNGMTVTDYYTFSPTAISIPISGADATGENFVGTLVRWVGACPV